MPSAPEPRLLLALALAAGPAARRARRDFDFYIAGIRGRRHELETARLRRRATRPRAASRPPGSSAPSSASTSTARSTGTVSGNGTVVPATLPGQFQVAAGAQRTEIDWQATAPRSGSRSNPPRNSAPDPAKQGGTLDPISAGLRGPLRPAGERRLRHQHRRLRRHAPVAAGARPPPRPPAPRSPAAAATPGSRARRAAWRARASSRSAWSSARNGDGMAELERIETRTNFGRAVLERRG